MLISFKTVFSTQLEHTGWCVTPFSPCEIQVAHLKRFRAEGRRDGLSDTRLNRYMATLRKMFRQGIKDELITGEEQPA